MNDESKDGLQHQDRIGDISISNEGFEMKIIKYNSHTDIWVKIMDDYGCVVHTTYNNFKKGQVKNPFHKSVFGIGYIGVGIHKPFIERKPTKQYSLWKGILKRCYYFRENDNCNKSYLENKVTVDEEFLNFQNFAEWYNCEKNILTNEGFSLEEIDLLELDKDISMKNKYSKDSISFIPKKLNILLQMKRSGSKIYGVRKLNSGNFGASTSYNGKKIYIGTFETYEEAFDNYIYKKISLIIDFLRENKIPSKSLSAILEYINIKLISIIKDRELAQKCLNEVVLPFMKENY